MEVKEFYSDQEAGNEESTLLQDQDPYESEEALSLCDLPIYSDSGQWENFSKEDDGEDDFFEFFGEDFTTSTCTTATRENIIFCGKIIPFKDSPHVPQKVQNFESKNTQKGILLPWWPNSFGKAKSTSETVQSCDSSFKKGQEVKGSKNLMRDSMGKVSLLRSTTKSRWYLFMFGMSKLSTEMELKEIRSRQSRRGPAMMFPVPEQGEGVKSKRSRDVKGLWRMLKSLDLGCRSCKIANDVVKASF